MPSSSPVPEPSPGTAPWPDRGRAALLHLAIALLATFPMVLSPTRRLLGHPEVDVWNHAWGPWWFWSSLSEGRLPLETTLLAAPVGGRLWFPDALGALVGAPLEPLFGPVVAWNLVMLFHVTLGSVAGRALALAVGASRRHSWLGAVGVACSPYLLSEIHNGISEATAVGAPVLALAMLISALRQGGAARWLGVALAGGLTVAGTAYYTLGVAAVAVVIVVDGLARARGRRLWALGGLVLAALGALAIGLPALRAALWTMQQDPLVFRPPNAGLSDLEPLLRHNATDPRTFLWPGDFQSVDLSPEAFLHTSYLGLVLLPLALRSRAWALLAAAIPGLLLSLGPWIWFDGDWLLHDGQRLALPYKALFEVLPASALGHPQRVGLPAIALVAALAARGLSGLRPRVAVGIAGLAVADLLLLSPAPWPLARTPSVDTRAADWIRETADAPDQVVLDLPADVGQTMLASRHLFHQTLHGQPIPYKPDVRSNTSPLGGLATFRWLTGGTEELPTRPVAELQREGVRFVVLHMDLVSAEEGARIDAALRAWLGDPEVLGEARIWLVPAREGTRPPRGPGPQPPGGRPDGGSR